MSVHTCIGTLLPELISYILRFLPPRGLLRVVSFVSHRWREAALHAITSEPQGSQPWLRGCVACILADRLCITKPHAVCLFPSSLCSLELNCTNSPCFGPRLREVSDLRHLRLRRQGVKELCGLQEHLPCFMAVVMQNSSSLTSIEMAFSSFADLSLKWPEIHLPSLTRLSLEDIDSSYSPLAIRHFAQLTELGLPLKCFEQRDFLLHQWPRLRILHTSCADDPSALFLRQLMQQTPAMESLHLRLTITDNTPQELINEIAPYLKELALHAYELKQRPQWLSGALTRCTNLTNLANSLKNDSNFYVTKRLPLLRKVWPMTGAWLLALPNIEKIEYTIDANNADEKLPTAPRLRKAKIQLGAICLSDVIRHLSRLLETSPLLAQLTIKVTDFGEAMMPPLAAALVCARNLQQLEVHRSRMVFDESEDRLRFNDLRAAYSWIDIITPGPEEWKAT